MPVHNPGASSRSDVESPWPRVYSEPHVRVRLLIGNANTAGDLIVSVWNVFFPLDNRRANWPCDGVRPLRGKRTGLQQPAEFSWCG